MFQKEVKLAYKDAKLKPCWVHALLHHATPWAFKITVSAKNLLVIAGYSWKQSNQTNDLFSVCCGLSIELDAVEVIENIT